ncbi:hypothetical protein [[Clostridium] aminophilum]|uniref:KAP family P-loop domain-containing protein n=1 Tax=[Clostridium] aminophilum TaxID=1526 RepID=A0A1I6K5C2_9FIRM|nr:hypothetical protein [[Clostridium] aminophilum]SFR86431.1 hypothetical protein SAMN02910262_02266 [[Clostridium] aminophilum]
MRSKIATVAGVLTVSYIAFAAMNRITLAAYIGIFDIVVFYALITYFDRKNTAFIEDVLIFGSANGIAYVLERIFWGNVASYEITGRGIAFYIGISIMILLYAVMIIGISIFRLDNRYKEDTCRSCNVDFRSSKTEISDWFIQERKYDLYRLEEYLTNERIVGINGAWGTGKTELKREFCRRHSEDIYEIRIDALTCNEGELDAFVIGELEKRLADNHIFSKNSKALKGILSKHSFLNDIRMLLWSSNDTKVRLLDSYKEDVRKLSKSVIISVEDLDRLQDEKAIRKILDFTERLSADHIRVIYEYDAKRLSEMGFGRAYLEKYIPYVVNLTNIPFQNAIDYFERQGMIAREDYRFLTDPIYPERIIEDELGLRGIVKLEMPNQPLRIVKTFLEECKKYLAHEDLLPENKKTIIAFFFMKHFLNGIYEELEFRFDCLTEMRFESPVTHKRYSMQELINEVRYNIDNDGKDSNEEYGLTKDIVKQFFQNGNKSVPESEEQRSNREKFYLLNLLGYQFQYMDEEYKQELQQKNAVGMEKKKKIVYESIFHETEKSLEHHDYNEKISRLIRNLHANGLSEYTDNEAVAKEFIDSVLYAENMPGAWKQFLEKCYKGELDRDNLFHFTMLGEYDVDLAKALSIFLDRGDQKARREDVWKRFLTFRYKVTGDRFGNKITPEYISFCYYIDIPTRDVYLQQIREFNKMEIVGNLKGELIYREFLKKYFDYGFKLGFWDSPSDNRLDYNVEEPSNIDSVIDFLQFGVEKIQRQCASGIFMGGALKDYRDVGKFIEKNLEILKLDSPSKRKDIRISTSVRSVPHYQDKDTYSIMERKCKSDISKDNFISELNKNYENSLLSIREMRNLVTMYDECHKEL